MQKDPIPVKAVTSTMPHSSIRTARLYAIAQLLRGSAIHSQGELARRLDEQGFTVSQSTLSRDLADLRVTRGIDGMGRPVYELSDEHHTPRDPFNGTPGRLERLCSILLLDVVRPREQVLLKCTAGAANVIASALESSNLEHVVGCVAGNDTVVVYCSSSEGAHAVQRWLLEARDSTPPAGHARLVAKHGEHDPWLDLDPV